MSEQHNNRPLSFTLNETQVGVREYNYFEGEQHAGEIFLNAYVENIYPCRESPTIDSELWLASLRIQHRRQQTSPVEQEYVSPRLEEVYMIEADHGTYQTHRGTQTGVVEEAFPQASSQSRRPVEGCGSVTYVPPAHQSSPERANGRHGGRGRTSFSHPDAHGPPQRRVTSPPARVPSPNHDGYLPHNANQFDTTRFHSPENLILPSTTEHRFHSNVTPHLEKHVPKPYKSIVDRMVNFGRMVWTSGRRRMSLAGSLLAKEDSLGGFGRSPRRIRGK
jgi:hypothetical protein